MLDSGKKAQAILIQGLVISMLDSGGDGAGDISLKAPAAVIFTGYEPHCL